MQAFGWRQCISDKRKNNLANGILFALEIVIIADHPLSNTVEKDAYSYGNDSRFFDI